MEYGDLIWDNCTVGNSDLLESVKYESAKVVTGAIAGTSYGAGGFYEIVKSESSQDQWSRWDTQLGSEGKC
jgi:hypothetical protein